MTPARIDDRMRSAVRCGGRRRGSVHFSLRALGALVWGASLATAWSQLYSHAYRETETGRAADEWPAESLLGQPGPDFRIVVFVHPFCPCSGATVRELDESLARIPKDTTVDAIVVTEGFSAGDLARSRILDSLRRMPRVVVHLDPEGRERRLFGAMVSGETMAFEAGGRRVFHGGLTPGRGHQGDADGQRDLEDLACGRRHAPAEAPVFGCRLTADGGRRASPAESEGGR